jgi:V/A-type H+-transporting ATPase subunit D
MALVVSDYSRLLTPPWVDILVQRLMDAAEYRVRAETAGRRVEILDQARKFFTKLTGLYKNWIYSSPNSPDDAK